MLKIFKTNIERPSKFYSFLNATLSGRGQRVKFDKLFNIPIYDKKKFKFGHIKFLTKRNKEVLSWILRGYFIFWFAICHVSFHYFKKHQEFYKSAESVKVRKAYNQYLDINFFYYFFKNNFNEYLKYNLYFKDWIEAYSCDSFFYNHMIEIYNFKFIYSLDYFYLLLNMQRFKYENNSCLIKEKDRHN